MIASAVTVRSQGPAMPTWYRPAIVGGRRTAPPVARPFARSRRSPEASAATTGAAYTIVDLGMPPGLSDPIPYAVDASGDVALQFDCAAASCGNGFTNGSYAFLYVAPLRQNVPLARFPSPGIVDYEPLAMSITGEFVVGCATVPLASGGAVQRPVIWQRTSLLASSIAFLDTGNPTASGCADAISRAGNQIVGTTIVPGSGSVPARFTRTSAQVLSAAYPAPFRGGDAFGVDDSGVAVGDLEGEAATFAGGAVTLLQLPDDPPGRPGTQSSPSYAFAIGDDGAIVGAYTDQEAPGLGPDVFPAGFYVSPPTLKAPQASEVFAGNLTFIPAINDFDVYVGTTFPYNVASGQESGPFATFGFLADLLPQNPPPALVPATATAVNDTDEIVGQAYVGSVVHAFEMIPVPGGCVSANPRLPDCP